ncbi:hypothetical protein D4R51_03680 [bacterium]|nr:MAG: hypothetical protein D4R51_03680 [bacterium]
MGLSRFIGSIFFYAVGLAVFSYLNDAWQLGVEKMGDIQKIGAKGYGALIIAMVTGLIGLVIGQSIGGAVRIKSDNLAEHLTIGWHYLANTSIIWMILNGIGVSLALGNTAENFFYGRGEDFFITAWIMAAIGSQLISWSLFISGRINLSGNSSLGNFFARALPILVGVSMGVVQFGMYDLNILFGGVAGFILPYILIPVCANMWRKDSAMRN